MKRCPGSMAFAQPKIEIVPCPNCGADVEIWSDEADGICRTCGKTTIRMVSQSCVDWCRYAAECLGDEKYRKYRDMKVAARKEALLRAMEDQMGGEDSKRLARAAVAVAHQLLAQEPGADPNIVIAAAALYVEETPVRSRRDATAARRILAELSYPEGFINEVASIVEGPCADSSSSLNARVVHDATLLAHLRLEGVGRPVAEFLTLAGRHLAETDARG